MCIAYLLQHLLRIERPLTSSMEATLDVLTAHRSYPCFGNDTADVVLSDGTLMLLSPFLACLSVCMLEWPEHCHIRYLHEVSHVSRQLEHCHPIVDRVLQCVRTEVPLCTIKDEDNLTTLLHTINSDVVLRSPALCEFDDVFKHRAEMILLEVTTLLHGDITALWSTHA